MAKNLEYTQMAYLYDKLYSHKNYTKEVEFICHFLKSQEAQILDAGCGTGNHAKILNDKGYNIFGFDLNKDMLNIANKKIPNHFHQENLLEFNTDKKYDLVISFFAVFNHLKNIKEFKTALINLRNACNENGIIIIDLHNPLHSGEKTDTIDNVTRIMKWHKCRVLNKEYSKITYILDDKTYISHHTFTIFTIKKLRKLAQNIGFKNIEFYENYDINHIAHNKSKNIQMVLYQ